MDSGEEFLNKKPSLPIGWVLPDKVTIQDYLERRSFTEVYLLSDQTFLYLFLDADIQKKINERQIEHEILYSGSRQLTAKRFKSHSHDELNRRLKSIVTRTGLNAVAGMSELKEVLLRDVIHPFTHRETYQKYKLDIPNGILFFGPPGCGKTFIVKRLAEELDIPLFEIRESDVGSPYVHATTGNISRAFKEALKNAPAIVFIDEISGLIPKREGLGENHQYREGEINEFLIQLESAGNRGLLVIGATNFPERLDSAALRSGRMDKRVFVSPPDYPARIEMFKLELEDRPLESDIVLELLANLTEGYVASDIRLVVDNAARAALANKQLIGMPHLQAALDSTKPSLTAEELEVFQRFQFMERK